MNKTTLDKIKASALYLEELLSAEAELLKVAQFVVEPSHKKKLKAVIKLITQDTPTHLDPPIAMGYQILRVVRGASLTHAEIGAKIGKSAESVKQAIAALKAGGLDFTETNTGRFQATGAPRSVRGRL